VYDVIVNLKSDNGTRLVERLKEAGETTTNSGGRDLSNVDWRDGCDAANSHSCEESARVYETDLVGGHSAENGTDDENYVGDDDDHAATE
jgi:hypothetical protein